MEPSAQVRAPGAERSHTSSRGLILAVVALVLALAAGCGDDEPASPVVAKVGETSITRADLDQAMKPIQVAFASKDVAAADERKYERGVLDGLVQAEWVAQEAQARGISVGPGALRAALAEQQKAYPNEAAWLRSLAKAGTTRAAVIRGVRTQLLHQKLVEVAAAGQPAPSPAQQRAYFRANRDRFGVPEIRLAYVLRTDSDANARAAKRALADGARWPAVVRRYSTEPASRKAGAYRVGTTPGEWEAPLDRAAFGARPRTLVGPVRSSQGWHVFEIARVTKPQARTFDEVRQDVETTVIQDRRQRATAGFEHLLEERYKPKTVCARTVRLEGCGAHADLD